MGRDFYTDGWMNGWTNKQKDALIGGQRGRSIDEVSDQCLDGQMAGWMMDRRKGGMMKDGLID